MMPADGQPWFHAAVQLLDLRPQDRVLALSCDPGQARDLAALVGRRGEITVVSEQGRAAEAIADAAPPQVEVLAHAIDGSEQFGTFDALLVAPPFGPLLPSGYYGGLARRNLRPGGRCVIDLPGVDMVPELSAAGQDLGWPQSRLAALRGIGDDELAEVLRNAGLRSVHGLLGAHLLHMGAPHELVDRFAAALRLDAEQRLDLARALVRRSGGTGPIDVLVHRTRLQALR